MLVRNPGEAPYCMVSQSAVVTSMANSAYTAVVWDNIIDDRWKMAAAASASITVPKAGLYLCEGAVEFAPVAASTRRFVALQYNAQQWRGTSVLSIVSGNPTTGVSRLMKLLAGDVIKLAGFQDSGGAINTAISENAPYFNVLWLRP